jgi:antitoxin (DNA-binding transcriptional repressor) of toxin-antitoxin stability system
MTEVTSKTLKEKTADCLDRVQAGETLRVIRNGQRAALLVPDPAAEDASWPEIMAEVWKLRDEATKSGKKARSNPVLAARKRRKHATGLR